MKHHSRILVLALSGAIACLAACKAKQTPSSASSRPKTPDEKARPCYATELAKNPTLAGNVEVGFDIGPTGQVTSARVLSTSLRNVNVELCLVDLVKKWTFQRQPGETVSSKYTFHFQPTAK